MAIRKSILMIGIMSIIIGLMLFYGFNNDLSRSMVTSNTSREILENNSSNNPASIPKISDLQLEPTDKVYTFLAPDDTLHLQDIYLEKEFTYFMYIELVTPHNITSMEIEIRDPGENHNFTIFESEMFYNPEYGRSFEIPFGTAKSGAYNIYFYSESDDNFNLYIRMEQGLKCLYDKIEDASQRDKVYYEVKTFENGEGDSEAILLETDVMYDFFIGRVSSIAITESNAVHLDYVIEAPDDPDHPDGVNFTIYSDELLEDIHGVTHFSFGTAIEGKYEIRLKIYCDAEQVNIAYAVFKDYPISEVVNANNTAPPKEEDSGSENLLEELQNNLIMMPIEWIVVSLCFVGGLMGVSYLMILRSRKNRNMALSLK
jgi:hypothetical protein